MACISAFYDAVDDCEVLRDTWPDNCEEQDALLLSIPPASWTYRYPGSRSYLANACCQIATRTVNTIWGPRWFHVWKPYDRMGVLLVVKQPAPKRPLAVSCSLNVEEHRIQATFSFLSGGVLATATFEDISLRQPLLLEDLEHAASTQAFQQGILETRRQEVACQLEGFVHVLPDGLLLWHQSTVTSGGLREWLTYLQTLSSRQLEQWDFYLMDIAAWHSNSDSESVDQGMTTDPSSPMESPVV